MNWIAFDIETAAREDDVSPLIPDPSPDGRLTDPVKMVADVAKKRKALLEKLPLDENGNTIVCLGYQLECWDAPEVLSIPAGERFMIESFLAQAKGRTLIGYCSRLFDLRTIIQRSRYLGIPHPPWRDLLAPYGRAKRHIDLFDELTLDGGRNDGVVPKRLGTFCTGFGLDVPHDDSDGSQVAALLRAGDIAAVRRHCEIDVMKTVALARRLGIIQAMEPAPVLASEIVF